LHAVVAASDKMFDAGQILDDKTRVVYVLCHQTSFVSNRMYWVVTFRVDDHTMFYQYCQVIAL